MKLTTLFRQCALFLAPAILSAGLSGCMTTRLVFNDVTCNEHTEEVGRFLPIKGASSAEVQSQACVDAGIAASNIGGNSPDAQLSYRPPKAAQNFLPIGLLMTMKSMREIEEGQNVARNMAYLSYLGYFVKKFGIDPRALERFYDLSRRAEGGEYIVPSGCGFIVDGRLPKEDPKEEDAGQEKVDSHSSSSPRSLDEIPFRLVCGM